MYMYTQVILLPITLCLWFDTTDCINILFIIHVHTHNFIIIIIVYNHVVIKFIILSNFIVIVCILSVNLE